jgi:hypothetical protein
MSDAPALAVAATAQPDPNRAAPAALPRVACLLRLVRLLVNYGTGVLAVLQPGSPPYRRAGVILRFGTKDLALIVARITCGLRRAMALEERLKRYVVRGVDLPEPKLRLSVAGPRVRRSAPVVDAPMDATALLAALPSVEAIAEQVRTRSLGVVITDICRDLGVASGAMDATLWEAMIEAVRDCGIDLCRLFQSGGLTPLDDDEHVSDAELAAWPVMEVQAAVAAAAKLAAVAQPP